MNVLLVTIWFLKSIDIVLRSDIQSIIMIYFFFMFCPNHDLLLIHIYNQSHLLLYFFVRRQNDNYNLKFTHTMVSSLKLDDRLFLISYYSPTILL
jgi:hypothetical protein